MRPAETPLKASCMAIIGPLVCCLGSLAIMFDNMSGQSLMASCSLTIIVHNIQASLELSGLCEKERAGGIVLDPWKRHGDRCWV